MNIICVICTDLLVPSDDVFYTPCGHVFHFLCLTQWLERSKSCPQCREKTTSYKIHRIYFNFMNNDTINEDACSLQNKVDKLNFQLVLKEKDIQHYTEKNNTLTHQNKELKKEVHKVEKEINTKNSAIYALQEQIKFFKHQCAETESRNKEIEELKNKLETFKNVQLLLNGCSEDIDDMVAKTSDSNTLITYISVMKREMTISLNKQRELRSKIKGLRHELDKVSNSRNVLLNDRSERRKLEETIVTCERENMTLRQRIKELESNMGNANSVSKHKTMSILNIAKIENDVDQENEDQTIDRPESASPYLPIKSSGAFISKYDEYQKRFRTKLSGSILTKKQRIEQSSGRKTAQPEDNLIVYDGLGGHSKFDAFPSPNLKIKRTKDVSYTGDSKKLKLDVDGNQRKANFFKKVT